MKYIKHLANPVFMFLMMCTFAYTYFFYLGDNGPRKKREGERAATTRVAPNQAVTVATQPIVVDANPFNLRSTPGQPGLDADNPFNMRTAQPVVQAPDEENPFNLGKGRGQMATPGGEQFFNQQNRQNPVAMPEENPFAPPRRRKKVNMPPSQAQNPFGMAAAATAPVVEATGKMVLEGHWIGLEVIPLTAAIAKANNIPATVRGVLIDEVTLVSANAGIQAVDVITAINDVPVVDLRSFRMATKPVALSMQATVTIYRNGSYRNIPVVATEELGIAQLEGAPMILATARSPHAYYGPCVNCHAISKTPNNTNQMAKDMGDALTKIAPNIRRGTPAPHRDRGACSTCHVIL